MADCMLVLEKRLESSHRRFLFDISPPLPVDVPMTGNLQRALRLSGVPCRFDHLYLITVKERKQNRNHLFLHYTGDLDTALLSSCTLVVKMCVIGKALCACQLGVEKPGCTCQLSDSCLLLSADTTHGSQRKTSLTRASSSRFNTGERDVDFGRGRSASSAAMAI